MELIASNKCAASSRRWPDDTHWGTGLFGSNVVVIGAGPQGAAVIRRIERLAIRGIRIVGVFDDRAETSRGNRVPDRIGSYRVCGTMRDLIEYARRSRIDEILIALPGSASTRVEALLHTVREIPANVHAAPDLDRRAPRTGDRAGRESGSAGLRVLTMMTKPPALSGWGRYCKAAMDRSLALAGLVLVAPLLLLIAVAIRLESRGPILFRQQRFGFNNRLIDVFKFRSMYHERRDPDAELLATRNDSRITRVGAFLRRSSLDELPQLFNVLRGDMSLVGPRPHATRAKAAGQLYQEIVADYSLRHKIKPGITGWAQVCGWRGETDTEEKILRRVEHDLYYIDHWSILFDLKILFMTLFRVPFDRNAF